MANTVDVGLTVHSINGDHILVVAVLDELQIPKLSLYRFLGCQEVSDLKISHAVRLLRHEVYLPFLQLPHIYLVTHPAKMAIDGVLHHFLHVETTITANDVISDAQILKIELIA